MFYSKTTNGFYDPDIHTVIPSDAVEITIQDHASLLAGQSEGQLIVPDAEGRPVLTDPELPTITKAAALRIDLINRDSELAMVEITAGYPESEITSWDKQETEARTVTADPAATTPLLSALATARGIAVAELAVRVIDKAEAFATAAGDIIGRRQALEDQINAIAADAALTDVEKRTSIEQVVW